MTVHDVARRLPSLSVLRDRCRALAMLDAVLSPSPEDRRHFFGSSGTPGQELASMANGSGDEFAVVFSTDGAVLIGFDHESPMSPYANDGEPWPGVVEHVPEPFAAVVADPAFADEEGVPNVTVCLWRGIGDKRWHHGEIAFPTERTDADGADALFRLLLADCSDAWRREAEDYYEVPVDSVAVAALFALRPLDQGLVAALRPGSSPADFAPHASTIGYPRRR
ncbi:hypothetical protein [Streptomyces bohaiensis]|uniref:hypothetical protein n=1 Tax=Streptomyces bohaiensis TaxID=1431344 RepID=UPI003B767AD7